MIRSIHNMLERMRLRIIRKSQIAILQAYIDSVYESEMSRAETPQERRRAANIVRNVCEHERNELASLEQAERREKVKHRAQEFLRLAMSSKIFRVSVFQFEKHNHQ